MYVYLLGVGLTNTLKRKIDEAGVSVEDCDNVVKRMATHILSSRAETTVSKYSYQIKEFKEYCKTKGFPTNPGVPIHAAMYISQMIDAQKSNKVINSAFCY